MINLSEKPATLIPFSQLDKTLNTRSRPDAELYRNIIIQIVADSGRYPEVNLASLPALPSEEKWELLGPAWVEAMACWFILLGDDVINRFSNELVTI